jgi:hypothetical protein
MWRMKIESGYIYQHDDYDEILVLGIQQRYDSYDTVEQTGTENGVYVQYANQWDGYGAMFGATRFDPIEEFSEAVREKRRQFTRVTGDIEVSESDRHR